MTARTIRAIVITSPDQFDQEWINRLTREADVESVERVGGLAAGLALAQQTKPDVIVIDREPEQAEAALRQLYTSVPNAVCIAVVGGADVATLRRLVMAGARDVLARPVNASELIGSLRTVLAAERDRRGQIGENGAREQRGKLVVVTSPKGGVGTTMIATNLAIALRQITGSRIALVDMGLQFGDVGVQLNMWSRHTVRDLATHADEIDDALVESVLQAHSSGMQVLLAPNEPEAAGEISGAQIEAVIAALRARFAYIVCDTWSFLDEVTEALLRQADEVLVVTTPEVPALRNTKGFLEYAAAHELTQGRITLVLNRFPSVNGIALQDVQKHLRYPVGANIPSEGQAVTHSVNRGVPIVASQPQSWAGQSLLKLAAYVSGDSVSLISLEHDQGRGGKPAMAEARTERRGFMRLVRGNT